MKINLALRFLLELIALGIFAYGGFQFGTALWQRWLFALGFPVIIMLIWGSFVSPKAPYRLQTVPRICLEVVIFGLASISLYIAGFSGIALGFAFLVLINQLFLSLFDQRAY